MRQRIGTALRFMAVMTLLTGILYPLAVTGAAQLLFPRQAGGSMVATPQEAAVSELIGQPFQDPRYFWGRPSATAPFPYNAAASTGSNLGPTNPALKESVQRRIAALLAADPENRRPIPADLVTASGSGLDPHITPAAALYQARRVAGARGIDESKVLELIRVHTQSRQLGILGEPAVHVLRLNLALDALH